MKPAHLFGSLFGSLVVPVLVVALPAPGSGQSPEQLRSATRALEWREIGPTIMGGRISDLAVVEDDPSTFYVGTATAGVWKTVNAGVTFMPLFEDEETASIGDVTLAPSNPNVVWVGTGEPQNRQSSPWGHGVYRSTDAGATWTHLGLEDTHHIARIQVHPRDPDVAYVAAVGHLWGSNPQRGVYKTTDGGRSWDLLLFVDDRTGAIDLAMDPNDPQTLFAAMYQRQRRAWGFNGGGPGSGVYRTTDGGATWRELGGGLPTRDMGRIGLDIYRGDGNMVCAIVQADATGAPGGEPEQDGVYCSEDRGERWEHRSTTNNRPMYYSQIRIDPNDPERIYLGGTTLYASADGGRTFDDDAAAGVHLDHHALWIDPANSSHLILGGDGGVSVSWDRSENWYQFRNLPLGQFYEIGVDVRDPYHVCGGLQDNGSWCAPSDTWSNQGIRTRDWYNVGSGDGFFTVMHPTDPDVMLAESQGGNLTRVDLRTMERARLRPVGRPESDADALPSLRWNWNSPMLMSAHDPSTIYAGANVLFRTRDLGQRWEQISPDLSHQIDRDGLEIMGVRGSEPQMSRHDGRSNYGNLTAVAESPLDPGVLYTGADDGRLHVTRDGGASWSDVTGRVPELPEHTYVTRLVASHGDAGTVFAAFDGHRSDDFSPYVYVSTDFGDSWDRIVEGLPESSINALAQHPRNPRLLFTGNEVGVYFSVDAGRRWTELRRNLPTVPVDDIVIHPRENDLVIGTHGRGIWIMEDITPLEGLTPDVLTAAAHLFATRRATSYNRYTPQGWTPGIYAAANPPMGARIRYHLGGDADEVTLRIQDADGTELRVLPAGRSAGLHESLWDLRLVEDDGSGSAMPPGPRVLPGTYRAVLSVDGDELETPVTVRLDPRVEIRRADLEARHLVLLDAYRLAEPVRSAREALSRLDERLAEIVDLIDDSGGEHDDLLEVAEGLQGDVDALRTELGRAATGASLMGTIQSATTAPTEDQRFQIDRSWNLVPPIIDRVNELVLTRLPDLYRRLDAEGVRPDPGPPVPAPRRER